MTIPYLKSILIALDQFINALLAGWPDETLSSRAHRASLNGVKWPARIINALFFWDREGEKRHCELAFESEKKGNQNCPETRGKENE